MQKVLFVALTALAGCFCWEEELEKAILPSRPPFTCLIVCPKCPPITCPEGTKAGYSAFCQCCPTCVIPEGDHCPWTGPEPPSGNVRCEVYTECCEGVCSGGNCVTESTSESTEATESSTTDSSTTTDSEKIS
ncbi:unnamed protein product [Ceutorhynchus assimilis]|uniref:Uncharacterized protein n=1 Tax=Ceutorhynchus assimilis TaxID=467358 RepID=A0A9N9MXK3_9CUCU|nr:unnamed protein product [Ceutorhynchus assimilis]